MIYPSESDRQANRIQVGAIRSNQYDLIKGWDSLNDLNHPEDKHATTDGREVTYSIAYTLPEGSPEILKVVRAVLTGGSTKRTAYVTSKGGSINPQGSMDRLNSVLGIHISHPLCRNELDESD